MVSIRTLGLADLHTALGLSRAGVLAASAEAASPEVEPFRIELTEAVLELDHRVTGADRSKFLRRLLGETPGDVRIVRGSDGLAGYLATRPGSRALMIGPCL